MPSRSSGLSVASEQQELRPVDGDSDDDRTEVQSLAALADILHQARSGGGNAYDAWEARMRILTRLLNQAERQAAKSDFLDPSSMLVLE